MKQAQFLSQITSQPWDMDKVRARAIIAALAAHLGSRHTAPLVYPGRRPEHSSRPDSKTASPASDRPDEDMFGDPLPTMQLVGNAAVIPVTGVISINVPDWIKSYGISLTDANDIGEEVDQALADPNVEFIVQLSDSPGGLSLGGDKLFNVFEAAARKKPVFTYVADGCDCCSAAYNSAAPSDTILVGPFAAAVGCVGSYLAMLDDSGMWEQMGVKIEVFRSGALKGIGEDALTAAQRDYLQSMVDDSGASIRGHVQKYRTDIAADDLQGQWYSGQEAAARGFAAGTAKNLDAALTKFRKMI